MKIEVLKLIFILLIGLGGVVSANVIGSITKLKGVAQIDRMGGDLRAAVGTNIQNKDIISTKHNSFVQVQMIDGGVVNIGENSIFRFAQYSFNDKKIKAHMVLQRGFFKIKSGQIGKFAPRNFRVDTKTAVIGIRGTNFYALIKGQKEDIGCFRGQIFVDTPTKRFIVNAGERVVKRGNRWQKMPIPQNLMKFSKNKILKLQRALSGNSRRCPPGKIWSNYMNRCILSPNSNPQTPPISNLTPCKPTMIRDPHTNKCVCPKSLWWSETYQRCIDPVEYCQRRIKGSIPVFTRDNQIRCECPKGYYLGRNTNRCYRYSPRPYRVIHHRPHRVVHHRRVHHRHPDYVVPALIGAAVIGGAIISHHHRHHKHRKRHHYK